MLRSLADQTEDQLGGRRSVLSRQKRDHVDLDRLIKAAESANGHHREAVLTELCRLVFPHAFAEEAVLWPAIRRRLADGEQLTLEIEKEHQAINELFTTLETLDADSDEHHRLFAEITRLLREDVRDEEDVLLPRLQEATDRDELVRLGTWWQIVRSTAPTRPHPVVARRPPGNAIAAAPLTALDRFRDLLDAAARSDRPWSSAARSTSGVVATAAGAIEHLPPLTRGERPATRTSHAGKHRR